MPEFKREQRYIVLKVKDIVSVLDKEEHKQLRNICLRVEQGRLDDDKNKLECVVVEADWPEYEPTWQALENRVNQG